MGRLMLRFPRAAGGRSRRRRSPPRRPAPRQGSGGLRGGWITRCRLAGEDGAAEGPS